MNRCAENRADRAFVDPIDEMLAQKTWAIVGVSSDESKYGYRIFKTLKDQGDYEVYPVNPKLESVEGVRCYPDLSSLPKIPAVVNLVVPPAVTEKVVEEGIRLGVKYFWMQPGAESERAISMAEEVGLKVVHDVCVMIESKIRGRSRSDG